MEISAAGFGLSSPGSSAHSSPISASSSSSVWDAYPLTYHARGRTTAPLYGRRPSTLASQVVSAVQDQEDEEVLDFHMSELNDEPAEMDMFDTESTRALSSRASLSRQSHSSNSSIVALTRQPSSPSSMAGERHFNPLNPQGLQAPTHHRESSSDSAGMQADSPTLMSSAAFRSPTPPVVVNAGTGPGTLQRAKSSPSLLLAPAFTSMVPPPSTPPQQDRRRFASVGMENAETAQVAMASPGAIQGMSTSPSATPGPAKRAVTGKRANLMPKPKAHLRVQMQLQGEGQAPVDSEVASEAALHRLARSAASALSPRGLTHSHNSASLGNRYPESIDVDEDRKARDGSSSSEEDAVNSDMASRGDDAGSANDEPLGSAASVEQEERRQANLWTGFRERPMGQSPTALSNGRGIDFDTFSPSGSPGWATTLRSNKRKMADADRFEPYSSMAFKRRAVSPTASIQGSSTPALGSPILGAFSSATITTPISIPPLSPGSTGLGLFHRGPGSSRASSPAASSTGPLSTSAGAILPSGGMIRGAISMTAAGTRHLDGPYAMTIRDDESINVRARESLGGMSLG